MHRVVFAYLDAGSGSLIIQMLVAGAAGMTAFLRYRFRSLRRPKTQDVSSEQSDNSAASK